MKRKKLLANAWRSGSAGKLFFCTRNENRDTSRERQDYHFTHRTDETDHCITQIIQIIVVSIEERAEVNSARLRKMEAITARVRSGDRREVYVVCMPGEPAYPVLAVCPPLPAAPPQTSTIDVVGSASADRHNNKRQPLTSSSTIAVVGSASADGHNNQRQAPTSSSSTEPSLPSPSSTMATEYAGADENHPPIGFLLKWETPKRQGSAQTEPALLERDSIEGEIFSGNSGDTDGSLALLAGGESGGSPAKEGEQDGRRYYGRGGHPRGFGKEAPTEVKSPQASLSTPACLWLTPRQIERAGGAVVKALTKVDKKFYVDLPYHWRDGEKSEKVEDSKL
ncbi:unnamed protein product [Laminaria digitata]